MDTPVRGTKRDGRAVRYPLLDVMRGLAALWVFTFHFPWKSAYVEQLPALNRIFQLGHLGVPVFFVVSGFCLMAASRATVFQQRGVGDFLHRRMKRIYPPLWCSILVIVTLPYIIEGISRIKTGVYLDPNPLFLNYSWSEWVGVFTLTQAFNPNYETIGERFTPITGVYWTLAIEVQFYLVMAVGLAVGRWSKYILGTVTILGFASLLLPSVFETGFFLPYWPMFALGIGLYVVIERGLTPTACFGTRTGPICLALIVASIAAIGFAMGVGTLEVSEGPVTHAFFCMYVALLLWLGHPFGERFAPENAPTGRLSRLGFRLLLGLGTISYSVYLLHGKLVSLTAQVVRQAVTPDSLAFLPITILVTILLCAVFYKYCERPFVSRSASRKDRAKPAPASVIVELPSTTPARQRMENEVTTCPPR